MKARFGIIALNFAAVFFVFFVISRTSAPYGTSVFAQEKKETTTTVADEKYGEGGTLESTSDERARLLKEVWKDKAGHVREIHIPRGSKFGEQEIWSFQKFNESGGKSFETASFVAFHVGDKWRLTNGTDELSPLSRDELENKIEEIEKQFARDGTVPKLTKETKANEKPEQETVEQPKLPEKQVYTWDSCLVGMWRSTSVVRLAKSGGAGIVMSIERGGEVTINYSGMQEVKQVIAGRVVASDSWSGSATGHIATGSGRITVGRVEKSELTDKATVQQRELKPVPASGLGPVFEGTGKPFQLNYTCDDTSLVIKGALGGQTIDTHIFKREKKTP